MGNTQTKAATNGTAAAPAKVTYPRAFSDHFHMASVAAYLKRALPLLKERDEHEQKDTLTRLDRQAAEKFVDQCERAVPDPDAAPTTTVEG